MMHARHSYCGARRGPPAVAGWADLPADLLARCLTLLKPVEVLACEWLCSTWRAAARRLPAQFWARLVLAIRRAEEFGWPQLEALIRRGTPTGGVPMLAELTLVTPGWRSRPTNLAAEHVGRLLALCPELRELSLGSTRGRGLPAGISAVKKWLMEASPALRLLDVQLKPRRGRGGDVETWAWQWRKRDLPALTVTGRSRGPGASLDLAPDESDLDSIHQPPQPRRFQWTADVARAPLLYRPLFTITFCPAEYESDSRPQPAGTSARSGFEFESRAAAPGPPTSDAATWAAMGLPQFDDADAPPLALAPWPSSGTAREYLAGSRRCTRGFSAQGISLRFPGDGPASAATSEPDLMIV